MAFKINVSTVVTVLDRKTPMAASSLHLPTPPLLVMEQTHEWKDWREEKEKQNLSEDIETTSQKALHVHYFQASLTKCPHRSIWN